MQTETRSAGYLSVALAASAWGTWPLILSHGPMPPYAQAALALAIPTFIGGAICFYQGLSFRPTRRQWFTLAGYGAGDALGVILFFSALSFTNVAIAVLTHYLSTFLIPLSVVLLRMEQPSRRTWIAVLIALAGLALLFSPWNTSLHFNDVIGALLGAASAVVSTMNVLIVKRLSRAISGVELVFLHGLFALPLLGATLLFTNLSAIPGRSILVVGIGALGPGTLGVLLFYRGLRNIPASHAAVLTLLEPFVAVASAAFLMNQIPTLSTIAGGLAILAGAGIIVAPKVRLADRDLNKARAQPCVPRPRQEETPRGCNCKAMDQWPGINHPGGWECRVHGLVRKGSVSPAHLAALEERTEFQQIPGEPESVMSARLMYEAEFRRSKDFFSLPDEEAVEV